MPNADPNAPRSQAGSSVVCFALAPDTSAGFTLCPMAMEFGWWVRDPEQGKYQVWVVFHGGTVTWQRHQGHHTAWEPLEPITSELWDRLMDEAAKRVPRRLMSPKQFDELKRLRAAAEDTGTPKPLKRGAHLKRARDLPAPPPKD